MSFVYSGKIGTIGPLNVDVKMHSSFRHKTSINNWINYDNLQETHGLKQLENTRDLRKITLRILYNLFT